MASERVPSLEDPARVVPLSTLRLIRKVGLVAAALITGVLLAVEPIGWRILLACGSWLGLLTSLLIERRFDSHLWWDELAMPILYYHCQLAIIIATGGLASPIVLIVAPGTFVYALSIGRFERLPVLIGVPLVHYVTLAVLQTSVWAELLPLPLLAPTGTQNPTWIWAMALFLIAAVAVGSIIGTRLSLGADRTHKAALRWQAEAVESMRDRNHDLVRIAGALAHEIKNPLTAIQGLSTLMASKAKEGGRDAERLGVLVNEVKRMGQIVNDLLNFTRPPRPEAMELTSIGRLAGDVALLHEGLARQRRVRLSVTSDNRLQVMCSPDKMKQLLTNLIQNALEASPDGGVITLEARQGEGGTVLISVDDDGDGLPQDLTERAFAPGITTKSAGSGLGLSIARGLAAQHGGKLSLINRPTGGCRALVTLPNRQARTTEGSAFEGVA